MWFNKEKMVEKQLDLSDIHERLYRISIAILSLRSSVIGKPECRKQSILLESVSLDIDELKLELKKMQGVEDDKSN